MKSITVDLKEAYGLMGGKLECICVERPLDGGLENWRRPAVIVVPGGGYGGVSRREGESVATRFLAAGYQAFILTYLVRPDGARYPEQLLELAASVDYVRTHADEFHVNPDEIFPIGFSAGGHLVGNLAVEWQDISRHTDLKLDCAPTAVGLCYPVIRNDAGHTASHNALLNGYTEEEKAALLPRLNLDDMDNENTPPAFLWSTFEDSCVPPKNTLLYALAMEKARIRYELHIYPCANHGKSSCDLENNTPEPCLKKNGRWVEECTSFFRLYVKEPF